MLRISNEWFVCLCWEPSRRSGMERKIGRGFSIGIDAVDPGKLNYILKQQKSSVIMVTSTIPGEGKSMVATHLANAYAKAGGE
ncbi:MAG: hypothetical protein ACLU4N_11340 [Butyricimonas faecihominis]